MSQEAENDKWRFFDKGTLSPDKDDRYQLWWVLFWIVFFLMTYLARAIFDPDFFWHLKTGEWIWQHRMLPDHDPFSLAPAADLTIKQKFTLTSYWLSQLIYYGLTRIADWWGIALLRIVLAAALVFSIYKRCKKNGWSLKILLVIAGFILLSTYPFERPQIFSFVGFSALLYLLHKFRAAGREPGLFASISSISVLMLLWGNLHGGILLGQLSLIAYLCFLSVDYYLLKPALSQRHYLVEAVACLSGILFSLANPNSMHFFDILITMLKGNEVLAFNSEYRNFFSIFTERRNTAPAAIFIILFVAYLVRGAKKDNLFTVATCVTTAIMGLYQIRYMPFFIIAVIPLAASVAENSVRSKLIKWVLVLVVAFQFVVFAPFELNNIAELRYFGFVHNTRYTPVSAVDFIVKNNLKGNILNAYDWGGYLIYRIGPEQKVYVDGRALYEDSYWEWFAVSHKITNEGYSRGALFDKLVDKYRFKYVLVPRYSGVEMAPLVTELNKHKDWKDIYNDTYSIIFARQ